MEVENCTIELLSDTEVAYRNIYGKRETEAISVSPLTKKLLERFNYWISNQKLKERNDLELLGLCLYDLLLPPGSKVREDFEMEYDYIIRGPNRRLRLTLVFHEEAGELANYPWEFLMMPPRLGAPNKPKRDPFFLAGQKVQLILTRFMPDVEHRLGELEKQLRILLVFSNPSDKDLDDLNTQDTKDAIATITNLEKLGSVTVRLLKNPTYKELNDQINEPAKPGEEPFKPHIVHFIGHGNAKQGLALTMSAKEQGERARDRLPKKAAWCDAKTICDLFDADPPPRLVFLHACEGAKSETLESFSNLARELARAKIPAVIAMQYDIKTEDAALFARVFYEELSNGAHVDEAVAKGRASLGLPERGGTGSWSDRRFGTPVVYLQSDKPIVEISRRKMDYDPNQRVPCPNPNCNATNLTLDLVVCVNCDHEVKICPNCESQGTYRLMDKTIGRCGKCGARDTDRQITPGMRSSTERQPSPPFPSEPSAADALSSPAPALTESSSSASVVVPDTGSSN